MKTLLLFLFIASIFCSCHKEYSVEGLVQPPADTIVIDTTLSDTTLFFDVVINGEREFHIIGRNTYDSYFSGGGSDSSEHFETGIEAYNHIPGLIFFRGNVRIPATDTTRFLKNLRRQAAFQQGDYTYTAQPDLLSGIWIHWKDKNGKTWGTNYGSGLQSGSNFRINRKKNFFITADGLVHGIRLDCVFSCFLYDSAGNKLELKNGRLRTAIWLQ